MERNITISLEKAREWFYSNNESLKEVALQAFTDEELKKPSWESIKTFEDAIKALGTPPGIIEKQISTLNSTMPRNIKDMLIALYKLHFIRKALNGVDWEPALNNGTVYYSWLRWYPKDDSYPTEWTKIGEFKDTCSGEYYTLVGGGDSNSFNGGLGNFLYGYGCSYTNMGLLGCRNNKVARHLIKYFGKVVFDAIHGQYNNYEWV